MVAGLSAKIYINKKRDIESYPDKVDSSYCLYKNH